MRRLLRLPGKLSLEVLRRVDPVRYARAIGVKVGEGCKLISTNFGSEPYLIRLGNRVEITHGVKFITHDGAVWALRDRHPDLDVLAPIVVEDHAFIGTDAILLPGVTIGERAVVAAGSVVTRDVPPNTIVAGSPAKPLSTLEEYEARVLERSLDTKRMTPAQKRRFLEDHFRERMRSEDE